jgi:hypothetical protein
MYNIKQHRIEMLSDCINKIKEVSTLYTMASPGWTLIHAAWGHINSLHYLESETNFDEKTLGVIFNNDQK